MEGSSEEERILQIKIKILQREQEMLFTRKRETEEAIRRIQFQFITELSKFNSITNGINKFINEMGREYKEDRSSSKRDQ